MMSGDARKTALYILNRLDSGHKTLDSVLDEDFEGKDLLSRRDRALLYALVYGVLRWRGRLDWIIGHFSKTSLDRIRPDILNILRLGLFQIMCLNRVPVSAAVNTSVELAKLFSAPWVVGFVNALLRNMARGYKAVPLPDTDDQPVAALAAEKSFPDWLIKRWLNRFGLNETIALCDAINTIPPITLRVNTLKTDRQTLTRSLVNEAKEIQNTRHAPEGICLHHLKEPISEMKSFQQGWFQVQDEAAQLITYLLNPQPDDTVLDACAGLGGKTGHIAQMMKNRGKIIAMDNDEKKLLQIGPEMLRLGVTIVETLNYDLNVPLSRKRFKEFDRILVDAPCSGLGVMRRNPDTKWLSSKKNLGRFQKRQISFLENLRHLVKPSGILAYAVCSTEPEENEEVVKAFLNKQANFVMDKRPAGLPEKAYALVNQNGYFKTLPHLNNMDGFFSVRFRRIK
ncbi:16S rRNA (cytosine(967)-C(5))-methyltransferase RsmB [Thermodesulfobacteriota bacterium]